MSIEIDIDRERNYLTGLTINEGLDISLLAAVADEVVLHVEPGGWPASLESQRKARSLVNYVVGQLELAGTKVSLFFWGLKKASDITRALSLARGAGAYSCILFDPQLSRLAGWLEDQ